MNSAVPLPGVGRIAVREILLLLTNQCNLACRHCYTQSKVGAEYGLSRERVMRLVDEAYDEIGSLRFALSGGEALSRSSDCLAILEHAAARHEIKIISNGTLIGSRLARALAGLMMDIKISLDGGSAEVHDAMRGEGMFERSIRGIEALLAAGFPAERMQIGAVLTQDTLAEVAPLLALGRRFDIAMIRFDALNKIGRARENWRVVPADQSDPDSLLFKRYFAESFAKDHGADWCLVDIDAIVPPFDCLQIYYDGSVFPYTPFDLHAERANSVGNINETSLREILTGPKWPYTVLKKIVTQRRGPPGSARSFYAVHKSMSPTAAARVLGIPCDKLNLEVGRADAGCFQGGGNDRVDRLA